MAEKQAEEANERRKVFVVHGRNNAAREALFTFLRAIGLQPLEWSEIVKATGKQGPRQLWVNWVIWRFRL